AVVPLAGGKSVYALVHSIGGDLQINVYPDLVNVDAIVPSDAARRTIAAMTAAYFAPAIDAAAVKTAQRDSAVLAVQNRYTSEALLHDALFERLFSAGPAHYPAIPYTVEALTRITPEAVAAFARRAFRSSNAFLSLAGNVDASSLDAITDGTASGGPDRPFDSTLAASPASGTTPGAVTGVGFAWVGPSIEDERAATALDFVADYLFREGTGVVAQALDAGSDDAYVRGQFVTLHDPGIMLVTLGGDSLTGAKARVLDAIGKLAKPMDPQAFAAAREAFLYHLASDTQTPDEQADNLGWYAAEGNPSYAPGSASGDYLRVARSLDPQFVAGIVRRYLSNPVVITLVAPAKESAS
ncbi:MAG TPA: insulinase family protein, partial [Verrucomicrobiae bacterium]|nr:insulinase family protein [Verrucomicrobiae bacterium]